MPRRCVFLHRVFNLLLCLLSGGVCGDSCVQCESLILFSNLCDLLFDDSVAKAGTFYLRVMEIKAALLTGALDGTAALYAERNKTAKSALIAAFH